jgi:hypothetical protein
MQQLVHRRNEVRVLVDQRDRVLHQQVLAHLEHGEEADLADGEHSVRVGQQLRAHVAEPASHIRRLFLIRGGCSSRWTDHLSHHLARMRLYLIQPHDPETSNLKTATE